MRSWEVPLSEALRRSSVPGVGLRWEHPGVKPGEMLGTSKQSWGPVRTPVEGGEMLLVWVPHTARTSSVVVAVL